MRSGREGRVVREISFESLPLLSLGIYCLYGIHTTSTTTSTGRALAVLSIFLSICLSPYVKDTLPSLSIFTFTHLAPSYPHPGALPLTNRDTTESPSSPNLYRLPLSRVSVPLKRSIPCASAPIFLKQLPRHWVPSFLPCPLCQGATCKLPSSMDGDEMANPPSTSPFSYSFLVMFRNCDIGIGGRGDLWWSRATVLMLLQSLCLSHLDISVWMMDINCWFRSRDVVTLYPSCSVFAGSCV